MCLFSELIKGSATVSLRKRVQGEMPKHTLHPPTPDRSQPHLRNIFSPGNDVLGFA